MKGYWKATQSSRVFGLKLGMVIGVVLLWGLQPSCVSGTHAGAKPETQETGVPIASPRSAVVTRVGDPAATSIDLRVLRVRANETGHRVLCSSTEVLRFALRDNCEAYVTVNGGVYVVSTRPIRSLVDKDLLEAKLDEALSLIAETRAGYLRPGNNKALPSQPFTQSLYYAAVYFVDTTGGAPSYYQSVLLANSNQRTNGIRLILDYRPREARGMIVARQGVIKVDIGGEEILNSNRSISIAAFHPAAGTHDMEWIPLRGVCRIEFLTSTPEGVNLIGAGAGDCQYVRTQPISQLRLPACLETAP